MIKIGEKIRFKITRPNGTVLESEGIVHGCSKEFGVERYVIKEWKGISPIVVNKSSIK